MASLSRPGLGFHNRKERQEDESRQISPQCTTALSVRSKLELAAALKKQKVGPTSSNDLSEKPLNLGALDLKEKVANSFTDLEALDRIAAQSGPKSPSAKHAQLSDSSDIEENFDHQRAALIIKINDEESERLYGDDANSAEARIPSSVKTHAPGRNDAHFDAIFANKPIPSEPAIVVANLEPLPSVRMFNEKFVQPPNHVSNEGMLFKQLRAGQIVESRYSGDGKWYKAEIRQVVHGGFSNATYTVVYLDTGDEETRSWKDLNLLPGDEGMVSVGEHVSEVVKKVGLIRGSSLEEQTTSLEVTAPTQINPLASSRSSSSIGNGGWRERARRKQ